MWELAFNTQKCWTGRHSAIALLQLIFKLNLWSTQPGRHLVQYVFNVSLAIPWAHALLFHCFCCTTPSYGLVTKNGFTHHGCIFHHIAICCVCNVWTTYATLLMVNNVDRCTKHTKNTYLFPIYSDVLNFVDEDHLYMWEIIVWLLPLLHHKNFGPGCLQGLEIHSLP